ncbi:GDP-mannose 4,6-dehydratase [subsurface metagenome]
MKALITGISGQDGFYLAHELNNRGDEVWGLVQPSSNPVMGSERDRVEKDLPFVNVVLGDLTDFASLRQVFQIQPDEIYHLGAISTPVAGESTPELMMQVNTLGTLRLLELIRGTRIRLLFAGSDSAFGVSKPSQTDQTPLRPDTLYGVSKAASMMLVQAYREQYRVFACNAILFNHTSPRQSHFFLPRKVAIAAARVELGTREEILTLGNLENRRDWSHAEDVVRAMCMILEHKKPDDYCVGSGKSSSVRNLCRLAFEAVNRDYKKYVVGVAGPPEQYRPKADINKLKRIGWEPRVKFRDLVASLVEDVIEREGGGV